MLAADHSVEFRTDQGVTGSSRADASSGTDEPSAARRGDRVVDSVVLGRRRRIGSIGLPPVAVIDVGEPGDDRRTDDTRTAVDDRGTDHHRIVVGADDVVGCGG